MVHFVGVQFGVTVVCNAAEVIAAVEAEAVYDMAEMEAAAAGSAGAEGAPAGAPVCGVVGMVVGVFTRVPLRV